MNKPRTAELLDMIDLVDQNLAAAVAIIDCVKVLSALDRAPEYGAGTGKLLTGAGFAAGYTLRDSSMPNALSHALDLLADVKLQCSTLLDPAPLQASAPLTV